MFFSPNFIVFQQSFSHPFFYFSLVFTFLIRNFFQISFVVLPKFCCSPSTIILFYHAIADPRVFGSFCNIPLSLSTIVSFFSHNYVVFYSQLKCLHNAVVLFPRILLSSSIRFCSSLTKLLFFYQYSIVFFHNAIVTILLSQFYCLILLHCYYFHNTNIVLFPQFYPCGAKVYKFCRNSHRAWIDWRSRQSRISRN